jgi:hypothetical protein
MPSWNGLPTSRRAPLPGRDALNLDNLGKTQLFLAAVSLSSRGGLTFRQVSAEVTSVGADHWRSAC